MLAEKKDDCFIVKLFMCPTYNILMTKEGCRQRREVALGTKKLTSRVAIEIRANQKCGLCTIKKDVDSGNVEFTEKKYNQDGSEYVEKIITEFGKIKRVADGKIQCSICGNFFEKERFGKKRKTSKEPDGIRNSCKKCINKAAIIDARKRRKIELETVDEVMSLMDDVNISSSDKQITNIYIDLRSNMDLFSFIFSNARRKKKSLANIIIMHLKNFYESNKDSCKQLKQREGGVKAKHGSLGAKSRYVVVVDFFNEKELLSFINDYAYTKRCGINKTIMNILEKIMKESER